MEQSQEAGTTKSTVWHWGWRLLVTKDKPAQKHTQEKWPDGFNPVWGLLQGQENSEFKQLAKHGGPEAWGAGSHGGEEGQANAVGQARSHLFSFFSVPLAWILRFYRRDACFTHKSLPCQLGSVPWSHS